MTLLEPLQKIVHDYPLKKSIVINGVSFKCGDDRNDPLRLKEFFSADQLMILKFVHRFAYRAHRTGRNMNPFTPPDIKTHMPIQDDYIEPFLSAMNEMDTQEDDMYPEQLDKRLAYAMRILIKDMKKNFKSYATADMKAMIPEPGEGKKWEELKRLTILWYYMNFLYGMAKPESPYMSMLNFFAIYGPLMPFAALKIVSLNVVDPHELMYVSSGNRYVGYHRKMCLFKAVFKLLKPYITVDDLGYSEYIELDGGYNIYNAGLK